MANPNKIILRVENSSTFLFGTLESEVYQKLREATSYRPENAEYMIQNSGRGGWDGLIPTICYKKCRCPVTKSGVHFPTGLLSKVRKFLSDEKIPVIIEDKRVLAPRTKNLHINTNTFELRDYQQRIIDDSVERERGIIKVSTGGGKTSIASGIIAKLGVSPFIFYVPSVDLLNQAKKEISKFVCENGGKLEVGEIGGGSCDIKDINVMTIQTAVRALGGKYKKADEDDSGIKDSKIVQGKYKDIKELIINAKGIIGDEIQHWASETCQFISDYSLSCRYKFGMSATPFRDKGDDILIDACFGKLIADVNASFLIKKGFLVKPTIYFVPVNNYRGTKGVTYADLYKSAIAENTLRNTWIANITNNFYQEGRNILILVRLINHGNILEEIIPGSVFIHGSCTKEKREKHLDSVRSSDSKITIATSIGDEGIDCKPWDTLILGGSGKSQTRALQRIGRILRPYKNPATGLNKHSAVVVDFMDNCKWMLAHSRKRKQIYQTEEEFEIEDLILEG